MTGHIVFGSYVFSALLLVALCIPLIRGAIAPNARYGIRMKSVLENHTTWYRINRRGGWAMIWAGCGMAVLAAAVYPLVAWYGEMPGAIIGAALPLFPLFAGVTWIVHDTSHVTLKS